MCAVSARESARLNRRFRGRGGAADVLSFGDPPAAPRGGAAGEVYLCLPVIRRRARRLGLSPAAWLRELTVHGLLHVLGFQHDDPASAAQMEAVQRTLVDRREPKPA